jgi:dTDP-glucose pyrophosphorylase
MTKPALLVLAAGMGSRFGGLKQIDPVGPNGETIIDYSVFDAFRSGFGRLVFVIRRDIEKAFRESIGARFESRLPVEYVFQELDKLPPGFTVPAGRQKPWGTGHAILMAADVMDGPFAVINGDDFYGMNSFQLLGHHLEAGGADCAMVGFVLKNTLSEFGHVARGVCRATTGGYLEGVTEFTHIEPDGAGAKFTGDAGRVQPLTGAEIVSMNMWGFTPDLFSHLSKQMVSFLEKQGGDPKAEFFIPTVVNALIGTGEMRFKVLRTPDSWFGVTYRDDRLRVIECLRKLIQRGDYPEKLWV